MSAVVVLQRRGNRLLARPTSPQRCVTGAGAGALLYATDDGWVGVRLDGETRADEWPAESVEVTS